MQCETEIGIFPARNGIDGFKAHELSIITGLYYKNVSKLYLAIVMFILFKKNHYLQDMLIVP